MATFREDPAAYMRARRARQKAEKEAVERAGGVPVFTTKAKGDPSTGSGQVFGYRDGTKPRPAPPSPSRALVVRQPASMAAVGGGQEIAGGRRVPAGYDAGTYPIAAPYRPDAMPSRLMHAIATVEAARRADRAEFEARIAALENEAVDRRGPLMTFDWGDAAYRFTILMKGLAVHGRDAARREVKAS